VEQQETRLFVEVLLPTVNHSEAISVLTRAGLAEQATCFVAASDYA